MEWRWVEWRWVEQHRGRRDIMPSSGAGDSRGQPPQRSPPQRPPAEVSAADLATLVGLANAGRHGEAERRARELLAQAAEFRSGVESAGVFAVDAGPGCAAGAGEGRRSCCRMTPRHTATWGRRCAPAGSWPTRCNVTVAPCSSPPEFAEAHNNLGGAYRDLGQLGDAVTSYRRALAIKPHFALAHCNLGDAYLALGQPKEAEASCRRALGLDPLLAEAHNTLGLALRLQSRAADAEASCRRALEINPRLVDALTSLAHLQADRGQFAEAEDSLRRVIVMQPTRRMPGPESPACGK